MEGIVLKGDDDRAMIIRREDLETDALFGKENELVELRLCSICEIVATGLLIIPAKYFFMIFFAIFVFSKMVYNKSFLICCI